MPRTFECSLLLNTTLTVSDLDSDRDMEFTLSTPYDVQSVWLNEEDRRDLIEWLARYTKMEE